MCVNKNRFPNRGSSFLHIECLSLAVISQHIAFYFCIFFIQVCHGSCVRFIGIIKHKIEICILTFDLLKHPRVQWYLRGRKSPTKSDLKICYRNVHRIQIFKRQNNSGSHFIDSIRHRQPFLPNLADFLPVSY